MDWSLLAEWSAHPERVEYRLKMQRLVEAAAAAAREQPAAAAAVASSDASTVAAPGAPDVASVPASSVVAVSKPLHELATELSAALDAAADDAERAALMSAASPQVREHLWARSTYLKLWRETDAEGDAEQEAFRALSTLLDVAKDDAARRAILSAADPQFVARWREHRTDTQDAARRRYLARMGGNDTGE